MERRRISAGAALMAALAILPALLPADALPAFGVWLRTLSLSGGGGNLAAWAVVLVLTALPALGLLWTPRSRWDVLLLAAAVEIFAGLFLLVNPSMVTAEFDGRGLVALGFAGCLLSTVLAWVVLRGLRTMEGSGSLGRTLERLLGGAAVLLGLLAAWSEGAAVLQKIHETAQANTADGIALGPTNFFLILLGVLDVVPTLLGCGMLLSAGRLARTMESDPFAGETVALAERLSRDCGRVAAVSVLLCAGGNLLQFICMPFLRSLHFSISFPVFTVLLAVTLDLLCRYFRRAKAVSDDNESII